jgi:iron complex outermembrane receptor protein
MLSSAAVLVMAGAAPAWASSADQSGQPAAEETGGLQDIIVTAQKREERLQSVPVAVTAVTGQALANANITDTKSLSTIVPSLNFTQSASFVQPFIRGVGSRGNTAGDEQIVPIYVDGVYQVGMTNGFF